MCCFCVSFLLFLSKLKKLYEYNNYERDEYLPSLLNCICPFDFFLATLYLISFAFLYAALIMWSMFIHMIHHFGTHTLFTAISVIPLICMLAQILYRSFGFLSKNVKISLDLILTNLATKGMLRENWIFFY